MCLKLISFELFGGRMPILRGHLNTLPSRPLIYGFADNGPARPNPTE